MYINRSAVTFCRLVTGTVILAAFFFKFVPLLWFLVASSIIGTIRPDKELLAWLYMSFVKTARDTTQGIPVEESRFINGMAVAVIGLAVVLLSLSYTNAGWIVAAISMLFNYLASAGFCVGGITFGLWRSYKCRNNRKLSNAV